MKGMDGIERTDLLEKLRGGEALSLREELLLTMRLSVPAMLSYLATIVMEYIDAAMVGSLGARGAAAVGLVSSSTWMIIGLCGAVSSGFSVQVAHRVGGGRGAEARSVVRRGLMTALAFSLLLAVVGAALSGPLPRWLGGEEDISGDAASYFFIYALGLPALQMNYIAGDMLQSSGNARLPSTINALMCVLNVAFNALLIFPSRVVPLWGVGVRLPGAGLGVTGAALGTLLAEAVSAALMLFFLLVRSPALRLRREPPAGRLKEDLVRALKIGLPLAFDGVAMGSAYVACTAIVAPLGTAAIAANTFAVTAEGLCYMPGYGIELAAATLVGQALGAGRGELARRLGWMVALLGMAVMTLGGALLYLLAPQVIGTMTADPEILSLSVEVLRIELLAEPLYGAYIVVSGVFRGAGDTLLSSLMTLASMWGVRLPLAAFLAPRRGLRGVWLAMCVELCGRGALFLARLAGPRWQRRGLAAAAAGSEGSEGNEGMRD